VKGDDAAKEWSTPFNWEKDPAIKAEWRGGGASGMGTLTNYVLLWF